MTQSDRRGVQAAQAFQEADNLDAMTRMDHGDEVVYSLEARKARAKGEILLQPTEPVTVRAGEAITWENKDREIFKGSQGFIVETLEHPNSISSGASGDRMNAALAAGVLEPAIDAAMAAQARNSIEKMLRHQLAAAHLTAMRLIEHGTNPNLQPADLVRLVNASARMMDTYQAGCLTLRKLKTRGKQRVLVQHVNVGAGGQAVVAGRVDRGSRRSGEATESKDGPHES